LEPKRKDRYLNMISYRLVFALALIIPLSAFAQREVDVDTTAINQLIGLSIKDQWKDPYASLDYAEQALQQAKQVNYRKGIAIAQNLKGFSYWTFGDNELAMQSAHDALEIARADKHRAIEAEAYYIMARGYMDIRENGKANESIITSEKLAQAGSDWTQLCSI